MPTPHLFTQQPQMVKRRACWWSDRQGDNR